MQYMRTQQRNCNMTRTIIKTKTIDGVKLPYMVSLMLDGHADEFRTELVLRYERGDVSCHIDKYTQVATLSFRNEQDAADFIMRV